MNSYLSQVYWEIINWCRGRSWILRFPVLILLFYIFIKYLDDSGYHSFFWGINLWVHEAGHFISIPFGSLIQAAGGTVLQCIMPVVFLFSLLWQRNYFGAAFCLGWLSSNFFHISWYILDAKNSDGFAIGPFGAEGLHDWFYILNQLNIYQHTDIIGNAVRALAIITMLLSLAFSVFLLWSMHKNKNEAINKNLINR